MARVVVPYANFSGGDWGKAEAWNAPQHSFSALNMYVTKAGELTVRGGLRNVTPSGLPTAAVTYLGEYAQNTADGFAPYVFYTYGATGPTTDFAFFSPLSPTSTWTGGTSIGNVPINDHYSIPGTTYYVTRTGGSGGATSHTSNHATSAFAGSSGGFAVALYLNRLVVNTTGNTLIWSDINATTGVPNFSSWTATNTVSVGSSDTGIIAIRPQKTHLVVFKPEGIFVITGDMPTSTVRQVSTSYGPLSTQGVKLTRNEMLYYAPNNGSTLWQFDGTRAVELSRWPLAPLTFTDSGGPTTALAGLPTEDQGLFALGAENGLGTTVSMGWLFLNGVWTKHTFPFTMQPYVAPVTATILTDPALGTGSINENLWRSTRQVSSLVMAGTGTTPKFYSLALSERPGTETAATGTLANLVMPEKAGDDSTAQVSGSVTFPEWHSQAGEDCQVKTVIVDFRSYNTGGSLTNHFDVNVTALRQYQADGSQASATLSYDEAGSASATGGTVSRRTFSFGDQGTGNGFQVSLTNVRGVAIQRVTVIVDTQTSRGMN